MRAVETRPPLGCAAVMMGVFRAALQEHHLPVTQQREAIAQVLFESGRSHLSAEDIVAKGLSIAGDICVFTNHHHTIEELETK